MEFITCFPNIDRQHDFIMVVVDMLTKVTHFITVTTTYSTSNLAQVFMRYIVRLHGVPKNIVSHRDEKFTSKLWKEFFVGLGTDLEALLIILRQMDRKIGSTRY